MRPSRRKVRAKSVAPYIFKLVLVWDRWDGNGGVFAYESLIEVEEVCEAPADGEVGGMKGRVIGLLLL